MSKNIGDKVIRDFGAEWSRFTYLEKDDMSKLAAQACLYFAPVRGFLEASSNKLVIADFGAGSGRWSEFLLPHASTLIAVEPSGGAFKTLMHRFKNNRKVILMNQRIEDCEIMDSSVDLAVSLGVLHHILDPVSAMKAIHAKLKPNGQFLCYLYYNFENRNFTYRVLWKLSNYLRLAISRFPIWLKIYMCDLIAVFVYFPAARFAKLLGFFGIETKGLPLSHYINLPFKVMRNDALDRFGTRLERRFSRKEIQCLLSEAGFDPEKILFSDNEPYWTFSIQKT